MILVTVGTQLPFDRFIEIVDRLAPTLPEPVFAQTGHGRYRPVNMEWRPFVGPIEFEQRIRDCSTIIAHAGIGTIVMAQKHRKPMILFPAGKNITSIATIISAPPCASSGDGPASASRLTRPSSSGWSPSGTQRRPRYSGCPSAIGCARRSPACSPASSAGGPRGRRA